eukprot:Clim_evm95s156 gene=Clim_evmTU95s156
MTDAEKATIQDFDKCDFSRLYQYILDNRQAQRITGDKIEARIRTVEPCLTEEEIKKKVRLERKQLREWKQLHMKIQKNRHAFSIIDTRMEPLRQVAIEPPGLFMGRGEHPKAGSIKTRKHPKDVTMNIGYMVRPKIDDLAETDTGFESTGPVSIPCPGYAVPFDWEAYRDFALQRIRKHEESSDSPLPPLEDRSQLRWQQKITAVEYICDQPKSAWADVLCDPRKIWTARWRDPINEEHKYVFLSQSSSIGGSRDIDKFNTARWLAQHRKRIQRAYLKELKALARVPLSTLKPEDPRLAEGRWVAERALALYLIDHLALRAGNTKSDDEADTVGVTTFRAEHMTVSLRDNGSERCTIRLKFLGKDSVEFDRNVAVPEYIAQVAADVRQLSLNEDSSGQGDLFGTVSSANLNYWLAGLLKTSKNETAFSSKTFRTMNASLIFEACLQEKVKEEVDDKQKLAERQEAFGRAYERANLAVAEFCNHRKTVGDGYEAATAKLEAKLADLEQKGKQWEREINRVAKNLDALKESCTNEDAKAEKEFKKQLKRLTSELRKVQRRRDTEMTRMSRLKKRLQRRLMLKDYTLSTSVMNYIDPRITVTWAKKCRVDPHKVWPKTAREKYSWAVLACEAEPFSFVQKPRRKIASTTAESAVTSLNSNTNSSRNEGTLTLLRHAEKGVTEAGIDGNDFDSGSDDVHRPEEIASEQ